MKSCSSFDKLKLIQASCHSVFLFSFFCSENKCRKENMSRKWREGRREKQISSIWGLYPFPQFSFYKQMDVGLQMSSLVYLNKAFKAVVLYFNTFH